MYRRQRYRRTFLVIFGEREGSKSARWVLMRSKASLVRPWAATVTSLITLSMKCLEFSKASAGTEAAASFPKTFSLMLPKFLLVITTTAIFSSWPSPSCCLLFMVVTLIASSGEYSSPCSLSFWQYHHRYLCCLQWCSFDSLSHSYIINYQSYIYNMNMGLIINTKFRFFWYR